MARLTAAAARRIALGAQGFATPRPPVVNRGHLRRLMERLAVVQLDSVNVFSRSHYLPFLARLGPYDRSLLDSLTAHAARSPAPEFLEYWAHEASILSPEAYRYFGFRKRAADERAWGRMRRFAEERADELEAVRLRLREDGPLRARELGYARAAGPREMWDWHDGKVALEYLFWAGEAAAARRVNFERLYDLAERVVPPQALVERPAADEHRVLIRLAARAMGVATEADLRDYFRLSAAQARPALSALVAEGVLEPVAVDGWREVAYLHAEARKPRTIRARTLLSPFDNLIWCRPRTERLFGFHYRLEIYTPAHQRVHGYYVLPFLLGERLVARVDLKSDRQAGVLRARRIGIEPGADPGEVMPALTETLAETAGWLGLDRVDLPADGAVVLQP